MKIIDGIKLKGKPAKIPNCGRDDLPKFFKEMGYKVGAEIGVYIGEFTEKFCKEGFKMYAIDPWIPYLGSGRTFKLAEVQEKVYLQAKKRLEIYPNCQIIRKTSMEALKDIPDGSLDFIYLDGDHRFKYIAEDLVEWSQKVRKGGIISGHDYNDSIPQARNIICNVGSVVDAYVKSFGIENFYLIGGINNSSFYDKYYSWLWIKN